MNVIVLIAGLLVAATGCSSGDSETGACGDGECGTRAPTGTCDDASCGGSPVGTWDTVTWCGPEEVVSVARRAHYESDGTMYVIDADDRRWDGTWVLEGGQLVENVANTTFHAEYCVGASAIWWSAGSVAIVRERASE